MNPSIAAASLLGFGDKPASEALQGFSATLGKLHETQKNTYGTSEKSRKSVIDEYNKGQREKKKRESDLSEFLKRIKGDNGGSGPTRGKEKKKGGGILAALGLGLAVTLGPGIIGQLIVDGVKDRFQSFTDDIIESINEKLEPVYNFMDKVKEHVDSSVEYISGIVDRVKEFFGLDSEEDEDTTEDEDETSSSTDTSGNSESNVESAGSWAPILDVISEAESQGRYDVLVGGEIIDGITEMTIVEAAKKAGDEGDGKNSAVGKYQFTTLTKQAEAAGLNPEKDLFSPSNQDKIAIDLIVNKRKVTKEMVKKNPEEAAKRLSMEWAGLPVLGPTKGAKKDITRGQSYYAGDGVNKSTVSPEKVEGSFQKLQKGGMTGKKKKLKGKSNKKLIKKQQKRAKDNGPKSEESVSPQGQPVQKRARGGKIFLHWAGSGYSGAHSNYHATIQGDGSVSKTRDYDKVGGGHTHLRNNQGIGISLAAMKDANDRNFGSYPVKPVQYEGMSQLLADIATSRGWSAADINIRNILTHAEAASGKDGQLPGNDNYGPTTWGGDGARWDLWKLYENDPVGSGGTKIRNMVRSKLGSQPQEEPEESTEPSSSSAPSPTAPSRSTDAVRPSVPPQSTDQLKPPGVLPFGPKIEVPTSTSTDFTSMDDLGLQLGRDLLAPLFAVFGALAGKPLADATSTSTSSSSTGDGANSVTNPNARALLNAIADAEGTSTYPENGYRTMFTGKQFSGDWKHPKQIQVSSGYESDAAGRYQFLSSTWKEMGMPDFSPAHQDQAALRLTSQAGVNLTDGLSEQEIYKVGQKWASVEGGPNAMKGGSYGSQAKYSATDFMSMYKGHGGEAQKLQQGGTVGQQINRGTMKGSTNIQMTRLREASQAMKKNKGPKIISVSMPPTPGPQGQVVSTGSSQMTTGGSQFSVSELADANRRLAMGSIA